MDSLINSFFAAGASRKSASEILTHVWNNRSTYFYKGSNSPNNTWIWSGDVYTLDGSPVNRYVSSFTIAGSVAPAPPNLTSWVTIIAHSAAGGPSITSQFNNIDGTPMTPYYQTDGNETSWRVYHVQATATMLNNISVTTSRNTGNYGTWSKILILPGKWGVSASVVMPPNGWSTTLQPGRIGWFAGALGYDGNLNNYLTEAGTTGYTIRGNEWWYNNAWSFIRFNPTQSDRTFQVAPTYDGEGNDSVIWANNRKYLEFYMLY